MNLKYDRIGDILYLQHLPPNATQVVREIAEGVLVRCNHETGEIEGYEIQGLRARPMDELVISLPDSVEIPTPA